MTILTFILACLVMFFLILYLMQRNRRHYLGNVVMKEALPGEIHNTLYYIDVSYYNGFRIKTKRVEVKSFDYNKFEIGDKTLI